MNKSIQRGLIAAGVLMASAASQAAALSVTDVATAISDTVAPITTIGSGVLLVLVALKTFHWVRGALR